MTSPAQAPGDSPRAARPARGRGRAPTLPGGARGAPKHRRHREPDGSHRAQLMVGDNKATCPLERSGPNVPSAQTDDATDVGKPARPCSGGNAPRPLLPLDWLEIANENILLDAVAINHLVVQEPWVAMEVRMLNCSSKDLTG